MMSGKKVFSNMDIKCDIRIDDATGRKYGLNYGGVAHYQSEPLDKNALLALDDRYQDCFIIIEEINVQYSNARRFNTNTNVDFNEVCQQLRKLRACLLFNVINEMFVDVQLRELTDFFVMTYDTAFDMDSLNSKKPTGEDFKWKIYPLSGYLAGEQGKYKYTHKPLPPVFFPFKQWRGTYNTMKYQEKGIYSMSTKDKNALTMKLDVESDPENVRVNKEWGWLEEVAIDLKDNGIKFLKREDLAQWLGRPITREISRWLSTFGIHWDYQLQGYAIPDTESVLSGMPRRGRVAALNH